MWSNAILATDADLTAYERRMPSLAKSYRGEDGSTAYDAKRDLAKRDIGTRLIRMGVVLDDLTTEQLTSLNKSAVYLELSLMFYDMSDKEDGVSMQKAKRYENMYEDSWQDVALALSVTNTDAGIGSIHGIRA